MTITEQFKAKRCVFSIECFPPKQITQMDKLKDTLRQMQAMDPGFISVTFGAGGSAGGVSTAEVADSWNLSASGMCWPCAGTAARPARRASTSNTPVT